MKVRLEVRKSTNRLQRGVLRVGVEIGWAVRDDFRNWLIRAA
jgi:hypothetical protein